jgi:NADH:ubiquinone reductase (H+-translocating)
MNLLTKYHEGWAMSWPTLRAFALGSALTGAVAWLLRRLLNERRVPILSGWPRVVIVGAGFGGLSAARGLARVDADVLVIDRQNYHCFQPFLYQVATAGLEPEEIAHPVRQVLRGIPNVRFRMANVTGIDYGARAVKTDDGPIPYDYLIVASGSATNYFGMDQLASHAFGLKELHEAVALRNQILGCFERAVAEPDPARRAALLTFVVAGGGPTGVEFSGALAELIRHVLVYDYPGLDVKASRVILVEAGPSLLLTFVPSLQKAAVVALRQKGVDVRLNASVRSYDGSTVVLGDGETIPANTLVWAAGVRGGNLGALLAEPLQRGSRVAVQPTLQLPDHPEVFIIGDLAHFAVDGKPLPMVAPVAIQQGKVAATNVTRLIAGRKVMPFIYHDPGSMATIGRNSAVCQIGPLRLTGFPAWVAWLGVHLLQIVSFRNRVLVLINWTWDYIFYDRAVRLITRD